MEPLRKDTILRKTICMIQASLEYQKYVERERKQKFGKDVFDFKFLWCKICKDFYVSRKVNRCSMCDQKERSARKNKRQQERKKALKILTP